MEKELLELRNKMNEVAAAWNGDNAGKQEDRATVASDILQKIDELEELLEEFNNLK